MGCSSDGSSTPRGDAELFDFDELGKLEAEGNEDEVELPGELETSDVQVYLPLEVPVGQEAPKARHGQEQGQDSLMAGPRQWEQWFADDCRKTLDTEGKLMEDYQSIRTSNEVDLIAEGKALEAGVALRFYQWEQAEPTGKLGALMAVTSPEFDRDSTTARVRGQHGWQFFTDAVNHVLFKIHKLFRLNEDYKIHSGLGIRFMALEYLLHQAASCHFQPAAEKHYQAMFDLLQKPKVGILAKLQILYGETGPSGDDAHAQKNVDSQFAALVRRVRKMACCVSTSAPDDMKRMQEVLVQTHEALEATWAMPLPDCMGFYSQCRYQLKRGARVARTSATTMSWLLMELRHHFCNEEFQAHYQHFKKEGAVGNSKHAAMIEMTMQVHRAVLPKHGFQASPKGAHEMFGEVDMHSDGPGAHQSGAGDRIVAWMRMQIMDALGMAITNLGDMAHIPQFHTVGDSHSMMGWPSKVIRHFQGPLLCYNVKRVVLKDLQPPVQEGDALCWCFGEIDCRNQVHRFCSETRSYKDVIDEIIERYIAHVCSQKAQMPPGVKIFLYNVPPPQYAQVLDKCWTAMPYRGTDEERRLFVLYFNSRLREECLKHGWTFFDIYDKYTDDAGFLKLELSDKSVHVADGVHISEFLDSLRLGTILKSHFVFDEKLRNR